MDKDQLEIMKSQDKYSKRIFILACLLSVLVFASIINTNMVVTKMSQTFEQTITEMVRIDAEKETEETRLYFETDYPYADYDQSVTQEVKVND